MAKRPPYLVILCEDAQHRVFAKNFLSQWGWLDPYDIYFITRGSQSNVRQAYPKELKAYRSRRGKRKTRLAVLIDADQKTVSQRQCELDEECDTQGISRRSGNDLAGFFIPRRNIETWITYMQQGEGIGEEREYPKLRNATDCAEAVKRFAKDCREEKIARKALPPSLQTACSEFEKRILS